jgi:cardiolipin synthase A/B
MIYFHWIYLLLYVVITVPAIITVLMDNCCGYAH